MALTEIYIDPSIAADSGAGTVGDPYGDLQYALTSSTFDTTNGTRLNIKAGTDEVLSAALDFTTNFTSGGGPSEAAQLFVEGYTSAAGDGGEGGISGGGSYSSLDFGSINYVTVRNMHCHNCGSANCIDQNNFSTVVQCRCDNTSGRGINQGYDCIAVNNYVTNVGNAAIYQTGGVAMYNEVDAAGANSMLRAIQSASGSPGTCMIIGNKITVTGTTEGINVRDATIIANNSIYSNGGTGDGIAAIAAGQIQVIANNIIEGFSGTGGNAIELQATSIVGLLVGNSYYDNETNKGTGVFLVDQDNETLGATAFASIGTPDWTPSDVGSLIGGAVLMQTGLASSVSNNLNRGAVQSSAAAGGGSIYFPKLHIIGGTE